MRVVIIIVSTLIVYSWAVIMYAFLKHALIGG